MRLNNKELKIVVDEIFKRVSQPTIDQNFKIEESIEINDEVIADYNLFQELQRQIYELQDLQFNLTEKYRNKVVNGYKFGCFPMQTYSTDIKCYIRKQKSLDNRIKNYPTKEEIKAQIIISGYSEIPELIERITSMYQ